MDVEYIAFGKSKQKNEYGKDDLKKEFYRFVSSNQKRETQLNEIILEYIGRIINSVKGVMRAATMRALFEMSFHWNVTLILSEQLPVEWRKSSTADSETWMRRDF